MKAEIYAELEFKVAIGGHAGLEWKDCRVLSFRKLTHLPFFPPKGMTIFLDTRQIAALGINADPYDPVVESVDWCEREQILLVRTGRVRLDYDSVTKKDVFGEIELMEACGFIWDDKRKSTAP